MYTYVYSLIFLVFFILQMLLDNVLMLEWLCDKFIYFSSDVHVLQFLLELFSPGLDVLSEPPAERGLTRAHLAVDVDPDAHPAFLVKDWIEVPLKLL